MAKRIKLKQVKPKSYVLTHGYIFPGISKHNAEQLRKTQQAQHKPGAKLDTGKPRLGLVFMGFSRALQEVGKIGTFGADKYTDNGWESVPNGINRYTDAMLRHLMKESSGEKMDSEMSLPHSAAVAWNALARLDLMLRKDEECLKKSQMPTIDPQ